MGGDGGTKAVQRSYLRGAGSASTTGDVTREVAAAEQRLVATEEAARAMTHCAFTDLPLQFDNPIVACPYGSLYQKEALIEALLRKKELSGGLPVPSAHIRGLKDLVDVTFQVKDQQPVCPVTGRVLNGKVPCYAMIQKDKQSVNVVSEYAIAQLGEEEIAREYGSGGKLRLVPPPDELERIKAVLEQKRKKKRKKQRKGEGCGNGKRIKAA